MNRLRRIGKIALRTLLGLVVLLTLLIIAVRQPAVQAWLSGKAIAILSKKLNTKVAVGRVYVDFFKTAVLENIFVADQQGDTLLYARRLSADIGVLDLFQSEIYLNHAALSGAVVNLRRTATDSSFNYQFVLDSLAGDHPEDTTQSAWTFGIGRLTLDKVRLNMRDEGKGRLDLKTDIAALDITTDDLDFKKRTIALKTIGLNDSKIAFRQLEKTGKVVKANPPLQFPGFGWTVTVKKIELENNHLIYADDNAPYQEQALDYSHFDLQQVHLSMAGLKYADDDISCSIHRLAFRDKSGFQLNELAADVQVSPRKIDVKNLVLKTPGSDVKNNTSLTFSAFNDLTDFMNRVKVEADFAESRLAVSDLLLVAPALRRQKNLNFPEGNILQLHGKLQLENDRLVIENLLFSADETTRLDASGSIAGLSTEPRYDLRIRQLSTGYESLKSYTRNINLPPALKNFGRVDLSGRVLGTLADLTANNLEIVTQSATRFSGDLRATGLPDVDKTFFDLKISDLTTTSADLEGFSEKPLPPMLDSLGLVRFAGKYKGTIRDFDIDGKFVTGAGGGETDLALHFNDDYSFARYRGKLVMENFDLGKVLGDTSQLGAVSLNLLLNGEGFQPDTLNTTLEGVVNKIVFRDYEYRNLQVDGRFVKRLFEGQIAIRDDNLAFNLQGKVSLNDSLPDLDVTVSIDTLNLKNLKLSEQNIGLSGSIVAKFTGKNLDNLRGRAVLTDFILSRDKNRYFDKKIVLEAQQPGGGKRILRFDANFLKARVEGRYNFADLPGLVVGYVNDFFPVDAPAPDSTQSPRPKGGDQAFEFDLRFTNLSPVARIFMPDFLALDSSAYLKGHFDSAEKQLELTGVFPNVELRGARADSLLISLNGNRQRIESSMKLWRFNYGGTFYAPLLDFTTRMSADTLRFGVSILDDYLKPNFRWGGSSTKSGAQYQLAFDPELMLNREIWAIDEKNRTYFSRKTLTINDLIFSKNDQSISVATVGAAPPNDFAPVELQFRHFDLKEVSNLLNNPYLLLAGAMDGNFIIREPLKNLHYNADIQVQALTLNDQLVGDLKVEAAQPPGKRMIQVLTEISGANTASLRGTYDPGTRAFDIEARIEQLILAVADPFLNTLIRDSKGHISGNFTLRGTPDKPALNGSITTHDISTEVVISGTRYRTAENKITFSETEIDFGQLTLFDANDRKANLSGKIRHSYLDDIQMDMRVQTDGLQILNTTRDNNQLYYGKLFAKADVHITGTPALPRLDIVATTLDSSLLHVEPLTQQLTVVHEDYIIFANPNQYEPDSLSLLEQQIGTGRAGFDLNLVLEVTPQARLNIIIDPLKGDELFCSGSGNFTVRMNPAGEISITGAYIIEEGNYTFNYEGLVKRDFVIRKGSSLSFTGDPYNARFDITAVYKTRATTYELISNETTLDEETLGSSKRRTEVEVVMHISGGLAEPDITFDINLPANQGGLVDNITARKLADLRDDPTELNKQVFGLLFFNSFIQAEAGGGLAGVGESAALKSVSSLITNQLNWLAGRLIKG
ncbi:MAG: translocation/assembly module TamB domain-containing protein, partial [Saprospiraceae bacterium]|nr:translocation/assembly module TamB domain-containing protein [Saprospiraceae bacterium]